MSYQALINNLWPVGLALQGLLTAVLLRKKAWQKLPFFTSYSLLCFVSALALFGLRNSPKTYFYTYWPCEGLAILLQLGVVYEIFRYLFSPYPALRKVALNTLQVVIVVLVFIGAGVFYKNTGTDKWHVLGTAFYIVEESARILELGLVIFLFVFSRAFHLYWKHAVFGTALGIGIFTTVELLLVAIQTQFHVAAPGLFSVLRMLSFDIGLLIWTTYMLLADRVPVRDRDTPTHRDLEQWNQTLGRLIYQ